MCRGAVVGTAPLFLVWLSGLSWTERLVPEPPLRGVFRDVLGEILGAAVFSAAPTARLERILSPFGLGVRARRRVTARRCRWGICRLVGRTFGKPFGGADRSAGAGLFSPRLGSLRATACQCAEMPAGHLPPGGADFREVQLPVPATRWHRVDFPQLSELGAVFIPKGPTITSVGSVYPSAGRSTPAA